MNPIEPYIPIDRRLALANHVALPERSNGAALFVDISGFTPLTGALVRHFGPRRGAEELTKWLNRVYSALIAQIEQYQGSVIGFSGDAITCWFAANDEALDGATERATSAALAAQEAMTQFRALRVDHSSRTADEAPAFALAVKTAIAAGTVRRFAVGVPSIQLIDVLAGTTLDRMAATEAMANQNELLIDEPTLRPIQSHLTIAEWRADLATGLRYAKVTGSNLTLAPQPWPSCPPLPEEQTQSWILPPIAERLKGQQSRFLAELRPAAALFLRFTGLDFDQDPDAPHKLDSYIQWVQKIIDQHEGALIQLTTGDKGSYLYATFGAPIAHDDDIQRAVAAAIVLRQPPPHFAFINTTQIGITYGMMRVGAYGGETRKTYGVLGTETNMAARLMSHAAPGQIVVSSNVAEVISERYELSDLGLHKLKGKAEAQPLFAVQGLRQHPDPGATLYTAQLVGRESELRQLTTFAQLVDAQHGKLVRIEGGAGLGKSHLVAHFAQEAERLGFRVVVASGQSTAQGTAYFAMRQLMQKLLALATDGEGDIGSTIAELQTKVAAANPTWGLRIPLLGDLLGIPIADNATTATFDARLRQEALTTLTVEMIQHFARQQRLLIVLEDIHWLDEASQGIVLALSRAITTIPILLVLVHRPVVRENEAFFTELAALADQQHLVLQELPPPGIIALVEARLQGVIGSLAASLIQAQAQGNPFFTEELVDALVESGQLHEHHGLWQLEESLVEQLRRAGCLTRHSGEEMIDPGASLSTVELGIPNTIQGIVLARLDRLPEAVKLTAKVASVIGRVFGQDLLLQAHPMRPAADHLAEELATLLARDFAKLESPTPRLTYIFKHNITQEVIYQTLLTDQRQEVHLGVATALEANQPERVEDLANHYYNCNLEEQRLRGKALHYLDAAGQRARHDYANETALRYFSQALGIETRAPWLKAKIEILHILGRRNEEQAGLTTLAAVAEHDESEVALLQGSYYEAISDYTAAQSHIKRARHLYQQNNNLHGQIKCLNQLGLIHVRHGDYEVAQQFYQEGVDLTQQHPQERDESAPLYYGLSIVNRQLGNYATATAHLQTALALYRQGENRQGEAQILTALGAVAYMQRDYDQAEQFLQASLPIQQMIGDRTGEGGSLMSLGQVTRSRGDYGKAAELIDQAMIIFRAQGNRWWEKIGSNELGIIAMLTGEFSLAAQHFQNSRTLSQTIGDAIGEAIAMLNLGQATRDQGNYHMAKELFLESRAIADQQGDKDLSAQCWSDLAICELMLQHPQAAIGNARQAAAIFTDLGVKPALTTEWCTLAQCYRLLGDDEQAIKYTQRAFDLLEELGGEGPDYPHRDYLTCYQIFDQLGRSELAIIALNKAYRILSEKATKISDLGTQSSFLANVAFNRQIVEAATSHGMIVPVPVAGQERDNRQQS